MIEIIIITYNRTEKAFKLAGLIAKNYGDYVSRVLIVDSTVNHGVLRKSEGKIVYLQSSHQNQPYQRFLGYKASVTDFLVFLDDDMEIVDHNIFKKTIEIFGDENVVAVSYHFEDKQPNSSLSKIPKTILFNNQPLIKRAVNWLTGYPNPREAKYGLCGCRGPKSERSQYTELLGGGAFAVKRAFLYKNFNYQLFDIYEKRLGKGEDGITGFTLSKQGKIYSLNHLCFYHNDQENSTYSSDLRDYSKRVAFSRLYLSLERARLNHQNGVFARLYYQYFMFWRVSGLLLNFIISPTGPRWQILKGTLAGWVKTVTFKFSMDEQRNKYWSTTALQENAELISINES